MPLYQLFCDQCAKEGVYPYYEATMTLDVFEEFMKGKRRKECPVCGKCMRNIICPPLRIKVN